jgi:hypothetical protein
MEGKFSHKLEVLLPWILLNINFLKENWQYSHAGWEKFGAKRFSKLLLEQCTPTYCYNSIAEFLTSWRENMLCCLPGLVLYKFSNGSAVGRGRGGGSSRVELVMETTDLAVALNAT